MEVVFVSHDSNAEAFEGYLRHMADLGGRWAAVPYAGSEGVRRELARLCGVAGIPTLTVVGPEGEVIEGNARQAAAGDPSGAAFPWAGADAAGGGGLSWRLILCPPPPPCLDTLVTD